MVEEEEIVPAINTDHGKVYAGVSPEQDRRIEQLVLLRYIRDFGDDPEGIDPRGNEQKFPPYEKPTGAYMSDDGESVAVYGPSGALAWFDLMEENEGCPWAVWSDTDPSLDD